MKLKIKRDVLTGKSTIGALLEDDVRFCFTLEDVDRKLEENPEAKIYGETAIPRGTYEVVLDYSNRFGELMPHILNVPGFSGVRMHWGNKPEDTEGCILVGDSTLTDWINHSRATYAKLIAKIERAVERGERITLEIV